MKNKLEIISVLSFFIFVLCIGVSMIESRPVWHWRPYSSWQGAGPVLHLPFYKYGSNAQKILDISGNNNHGIISGCIPITYPMLQPVASGSVTQANMKISAVNGTAFVDFSTASVLTDHLNHLLVISDSLGRRIMGFPKAVGTEETLSSTEKIVDGGFDDDSKWVKGTGWTVVGSKGVATDAEDTAQIRNVDSVSVSVGVLYKVVITISGFSVGAVRITDGLLTSSNFGANGTGTWYYTSTLTDIYCRLQVVGTTTLNVDAFSWKQVLTSSATGVMIVNQKGGATYNWAAKDANFNYNDSSGYTYEIYSVPGYIGSGWFGDGVDDRIVHSSLNLGTTHTLHYWLLYQGISGVIHGGAANYHGLRLTPTACGYNIGNTEVTVTHSANFGQPVLFSIDRNGTSVDFYKNGVKIGMTQTLGANTAQVLTDLFRYSNGTSYWNGTIFDIVASNPNKGAQEIRNYYELTRYFY